MLELIDQSYGLVTRMLAEGFSATAESTDGDITTLEGLGAALGSELEAAKRTPRWGRKEGRRVRG